MEPTKEIEMEWTDGFKKKHYGALSQKPIDVINLILL